MRRTTATITKNKNGFSSAILLIILVLLGSIVMAGGFVTPKGVFPDAQKTTNLTFIDGPNTSDKAIQFKTPIAVTLTPTPTPTPPPPPAHQPPTPFEEVTPDPNYTPPPQQPTATPTPVQEGQGVGEPPTATPIPPTAAPQPTFPPPTEGPPPPPPPPPQIER